MISIPALGAASQQASAASASSSAVNAGLFAQLLKARLDSSLLSLGSADSSAGIGSIGGTGGLMDAMLLSMIQTGSQSGGIDGSVLQELIMELKQGSSTAPQVQEQAPMQQTVPGTQGREGGIYISRVYTPDIPVTGSWPQHTLRHQGAAVSALTRVGDPYSQSRRGQGSYVDCSYLTQWAYAQNGMTIPSIASEQARYCVENGYVVPKSDLQIGDLVFWKRTDHSCDRYEEIHHVGIYLGDGQVVEASSSQGQVVINDLWEDDYPWEIAFFGRPA